jgi:hypothetical protein
MIVFETRRRFLSLAHFEHEHERMSQPDEPSDVILKIRLDYLFKAD